MKIVVDGPSQPNPVVPVVVFVDPIVVLICAVWLVTRRWGGRRHR